MPPGRGRRGRCLYGRRLLFPGSPPVRLGRRLSVHCSLCGSRLWASRQAIARLNKHHFYGAKQKGLTSCVSARGPCEKAWIGWSYTYWRTLCCMFTNESTPMVSNTHLIATDDMLTPAHRLLPSALGLLPSAPTFKCELMALKHACGATTTHKNYWVVFHGQKLFVRTPT